MTEWLWGVLALLALAVAAILLERTQQAALRLARGGPPAGGGGWRTATWQANSRADDGHLGLEADTIIDMNANVHISANNITELSMPRTSRSW